MADRRDALLAIGLAAIAFALGVAPAALGGDGWTVVSREWFRLSLAGEPCGSSVTTVEESESEGGRIRTSSEVRMRLGRGTTTVTVAVASEFVESRRGEPLSAEVRQDFGGGEASPVRYEFGRDGVTVREGGRERVEPRPDAAALPPAAASRLVKARLEAGAGEISFRTIDVEGGLRVASIRLERRGGRKVAVRGREIPVVDFTMTSDLLEVPGRETYSSDGVLVASELRLGIGELRSELCDEAEARASLRNARAEVLVRSFVAADRPIRDPRARTTLSLSVSSREGPLPDLPSVGAQRVERTGPGSCAVEIDAGRGSPAGPGDAADPAFLAVTSLVDHDSADIRGLLRKTLPKPGLAARERAERLRRAAGRALGRKDLASAFASASEAIRSGGGDCSEHAVVLAALLRADGIPARIVGGLIYADSFAGQRDVWGWHVWTQALVPVDGGGLAWIDLDATLPAARAFDAAHLATTVGPLAGGATDPMWTETLALLGNLDIRVREPAP